MLENLLNTKLKKKLLNALFTFPVRSFSISELRAFSDGSARQVIEALRAFVTAQVASAVTKKRQRYFRINSHFPLRDELKDLIMEEGEELEDQIAKLLKKIPNLKLAVLSGIFTFQPQLEVDLLLVGEGVNRLRLGQAMSEIKKLTGQETNFALMNRQEYEYRRMMNDRFIRDVLDNPHYIVINTLKK